MKCTPNWREYFYDPYGNLIKVQNGSGEAIDINTDTGFNHAYTYAGYRYDKEIGLYFLNARYYVPQIGRFLTKDTWKGAVPDPGTLNRYSYTHGDPVNLYDPSGHYDSVTDGPEGVDVYNSVSAKPYKPAASPGNNHDELRAASTTLAVGSGVVSAGMAGLGKMHTDYSVVGGGRWTQYPYKSLGSMRYGAISAGVVGIANTVLIGMDPTYTPWEKDQLYKSNLAFTGLSFGVGIAIGLLVPGVGWAIAATVATSILLYEVQGVYEEKYIFGKE